MTSPGRHLACVLVPWAALLSLAHCSKARCPAPAAHLHISSSSAQPRACTPHCSVQLPDLHRRAQHPFVIQHPAALLRGPRQQLYPRRKPPRVYPPEASLFNISFSFLPCGSLFRSHSFALDAIACRPAHALQHPAPGAAADATDLLRHRLSLISRQIIAAAIHQGCSPVAVVMLLQLQMYHARRALHCIRN